MYGGNPVNPNAYASGYRNGSCLICRRPAWLSLRRAGETSRHWAARGVVWVEGHVGCACGVVLIQIPRDDLTHAGGPAGQWSAYK